MDAIDKSLAILESVNNGPLTLSVWKSSSRYAKDDLKRKALIVINEVYQALDHVHVPELTASTRKLYNEVEHVIKNLS